MSQGINGRLRILSPVLQALGLALALARRRRLWHWRWPNIVLALAFALVRRALRGRSTVTTLGTTSSTRR